MIPKIFEDVLSPDGKLAVEKSIDTIAEKYALESNTSKTSTLEYLSVGLIVDGLPYVFYDMKTMKGHLTRRHTVKHVRVAVFKRNDKKENRTYSKLTKDMIRGQYQLNPKLLKDDVFNYLFSTAIDNRPPPPPPMNPQTSQVREPAQPEPAVDAFNQPLTVIEGGRSENYEGPVIIETEETPSPQPTITDEVETSSVVTTSLDADLSMIEDETEAKPYGKSSLMGSAADGVKNSIGRIGTKVSEFKDVLDSFKGTEKIKFLIEDCDMSRTWSFEGDNRQSPIVPNQMPNQQGNNPFSRNNQRGNNRMNQGYQQNPMVTTPTMMNLEVVHIYKDNRYMTTVSKLDFLDFFKLLATGGEIVIKEVVHRRTIKDEFEPNVKWVY